MYESIKYLLHTQFLKLIFKTPSTLIVHQFNLFRCVTSSNRRSWKVSTNINRPISSFINLGSNWINRRHCELQTEAANPICYRVDFYAIGKCVCACDFCDSFKSKKAEIRCQSICFYCDYFARVLVSSFIHNNKHFELCSGLGMEMNRNANLLILFSFKNISHSMYLWLCYSLIAQLQSYQNSI